MAYDPDTPPTHDVHDLTPAQLAMIDIMGGLAAEERHIVQLYWTPDDEPHGLANIRGPHVQRWHLPVVSFQGSDRAVYPNGDIHEILEREPGATHSPPFVPVIVK